MTISIRSRKFAIRLTMLVTVLALLSAGLWVAGGGAGATTSDYIVYNQQGGNKGTYLQYVDGATGSKTTQSINGNAGCATSSQLLNPVLAFGASFYGNGYGSPATATGSPGQFNNRTGVCYTPQNWSIDSGEGLAFSPGSNNTLTSGRHWNRAQIPIEREDKGSTPITATLSEKLSGVVVGSVSVQVPAGGGTTQVMLDTAAGSFAPNGFDTVEVQVPTAGGSVSVVGPTSQFAAPVFTFQSKICQGETISAASQDTSQANASLTLQSSGCKEYASFTATLINQGVYSKQVNFNSKQAGTAHLTTTFDFTDAYCNANTLTTTVGGNTVSPCPPTQVDIEDGNGYQDETFCGIDNSVTPPVAVHPDNTPWCVTERDVNYVVVGGVTKAHVHELWDGFGDVGWRG